MYYYRVYIKGFFVEGSNEIWITHKFPIPQVIRELFPYVTGNPQCFQGMFLDNFLVIRDIIYLMVSNDCIVSKVS
jgi:hypothetical protein